MGVPSMMPTEIALTESGKVIFLNEEHPQKAESPILFTLSGIVIYCKDLLS